AQIDRAHVGSTRLPRNHQPGHLRPRVVGQRNPGRRDTLARSDHNLRQTVRPADIASEPDRYECPCPWCSFLSALTVNSITYEFSVCYLCPLCSKRTISGFSLQDF